MTKAPPVYGPVGLSAFVKNVKILGIVEAVTYTCFMNTTHPTIQAVLNGEIQPATKRELSELRGVVYCIVVDGMYYVGVTSRSVKERYKNATLHYRDYKRDGVFYVLSSGGDLGALEKELVNTHDPLCLNRCAGGEGFGGGSNAMEVTLQSPEGVVTTFPSGAEAARHIGGDKGNVWKVLRGESTHTCGWTLPGYSGPKRLGRQKGISITDGTSVHTFDSAIECAEFIGCKRNTVSELRRGNVKSIYRKWRLA